MKKMLHSSIIALIAVGQGLFCMQQSGNNGQDLMEKAIRNEDISTMSVLQDKKCPITKESLVALFECKNPKLVSIFLEGDINLTRQALNDFLKENGGRFMTNGINGESLNQYREIRLPEYRDGKECSEQERFDRFTGLLNNATPGADHFGQLFCGLVSATGILPSEQLGITLMLPGLAAPLVQFALQDAQEGKHSQRSIDALIADIVTETRGHKEKREFFNPGFTLKHVVHLNDTELLAEYRRKHDLDLTSEHIRKHHPSTSFVCALFTACTLGNIALVSRLCKEGTLLQRGIEFDCYNGRSVFGLSSLKSISGAEEHGIDMKSLVPLYVRALQIALVQHKSVAKIIICACALSMDEKQWNGLKRFLEGMAGMAQRCFDHGLSKIREQEKDGSVPSWMKEMILAQNVLMTDMGWGRTKKCYSECKKAVSELEIAVRNRDVVGRNDFSDVVLYCKGT